MKTLQIISGIVSLIIFLFGLVFFSILPIAGIHFDFNGRGTSMEPAMIDSVELRLEPERAPYDSLQIGDIIVFRYPDSSTYSSAGMKYVAKWDEDHTVVSLVAETEEEKEKTYTRFCHRIIDITEDGLITKGYNNEYQDPLYIQPEDYQGKVVWHMNHIDWLFKVIYLYGAGMGCVFLFLGATFVLWKRKGKKTI